MPRTVKKFNVKVYSGRGSYSLYPLRSSSQLRLIKRDIRGRNRRLRQAKYPQIYSLEIEEVLVQE